MTVSARDTVLRAAEIMRERNVGCLPVLDERRRLCGIVTEGDLDRQLKMAVAMAEPLMLFFIAGFIGTIFIGMVLPIFTLQEYVK